MFGENIYILAQIMASLISRIKFGNDNQVRGWLFMVKYFGHLEVGSLSHLSSRLLTAIEDLLRCVYASRKYLVQWYWDELVLYGYGGFMLWLSYWLS